MPTPFEKVSEAAGLPISDEAASMLLTRYLTAAEYAQGKRTLELACASGPGLGLLSRAASFTVGADVNAALIDRAHQQYRGRVPLAQLSADALPFHDGAFELVLLLEASYYLPDFELALAEMQRVLAPDGRLLLVNANPERGDFIRSPFSHTYHSADEFRSMLERRGFEVDAYGAFPVDATETGNSSLRRRVEQMARKVLEALHLVPRTMKGRARLKRFMGQKLRYLPAEIDESFALRAPLASIGRGPLRNYKVIYVSAQRRHARGAQSAAAAHSLIQSRNSSATA
jgi:SAM-dependent methyltransferase